MDCLSLRICDIETFGKDILQDIAEYLEIERFEDMGKQEIIDCVYDLAVERFLTISTETLISDLMLPY